MLHDVLQDLGFALRTLRKRPLFTCVAVLTLGLGIGGTTAMFSVVDGVLLRKLPYDDPGELVSVWKAYPAWREDDNLGRLWDRLQFTYQDYLDLRDATLLQDVAVFAGWGTAALTGAGEPEQLSVGLASANLFQVLGVRPQLGRAFLPGEDAGTALLADRVVVLSHELWQRRFGATLQILGNAITLDGNQYTVIGILPSGFRLESVIVTDVIRGSPDTGVRDLWMPIGQEGSDLLGEGNAFEVLGRLAPGRTPEHSRAEIQALLRAGEGPPDQEARLAPRKDVVTRGFGPPLFLMLGAAGILLLTACANVATLLIGEATGRRHEIATRLALGASRARIARQLLTESVVLGLLGGGVGILLAIVGTRVLVGLAPPIPRLAEVEVSSRILLFAVSAALSTGLLFGLAPVTLLARASIAKALTGRSRSTAAGSGALLKATMSLQIALTLVLLVAGGLLGRSLVNLVAVDPGFDSGNLVTFRVAVPQSRYPTQAEASRFFEQVVRNLESVPGVLSVTGSYGLPFPGGAPSNTVQIESRGEGAGFTARRRTVLPTYHETMGIPLIQGRLLSGADGPDTPKAMVISQSLARSEWPAESPIGAPVRFWGEPWTIVGIVGDVRHTSLHSEGETTFYVPFAQVPRRNLTLVARTAGNPARWLPLVREAVWSVDADIPVTQPSTMAALVADSVAGDRYRTLLILVFGALAALLAAVGVFGVTARGVAQRTREMGIRMALGAPERGLVGMVLQGNLLTGLAGTALGVVGAFWASRLLSRFLFGVETWDPLTYGVVASLSMVVCLVASYVPARRVSRVSPVDVLRAE